jgi:hypothetical protein
MKRTEWERDQLLEGCNRQLGHGRGLLNFLLIFQPFLLLYRKLTTFLTLKTSMAFRIPQNHLTILFYTTAIIAL